MFRHLVIALFFSASAFLPQLSAADGAAEVDFRKEPFFPIVGFNFLWRANERIVRDQADMGLTLIPVYDRNELDWCGKYGLKGIVYRPELNSLLQHPADKSMQAKITETAASFRDHKAFYAMQYTDEPSLKVLSGYTAAYKALKKALPDRYIYTNLFPSWSQPNQHGGKNYEEYIETYCKLFKEYPAPLLVYDNYRNKDNRLGETAQLASFLENLDTVRRITQKYDMPFWCTVLGAAHDAFAEPNAADLDFQVFSSLAYGAKGIGYFTTVSHQNHNFQGGPFNFLGDKTPTYWNMRELNFRVRKLAPVLNTLRSTGCFYGLTLRDRMVFKNYPMHRRLPGRLISSIKTEEGECSFLIGEFKDPQDADWVLIVNLSRTHVAHFQAEALNGRKLRNFNCYSGILYPVTSQDCWLRPGQGKLYKMAD